MRKLIIGNIVSFSFLLVACGPSKELVQSRAKIDSLRMVVTQLNSRVAELNKELNNQQQQMNAMQSSNDAQISQMKNQYAIAMQEASD
ncbi:MAG TPA: hypothetical protein VII28_08260, partial [Puia sp.]